VAAGQGQIARARLCQAAGAADQPAVGQRVGMIENQRGAIAQADTRAAQELTTAAVAYLKRAAGDRRTAAETVAAQQGQNARARLSQAAGAADQPAVGGRVGLIENQRGAIAQAD